MHRLCCSLLPAVCLVGAASGGCTRPHAAAIQSADPAERILGIHAAGEANDRRTLPLIVDRLEDDDEAVRFYAILALDKMTGQRLGYDYAKPASERAGAVERWRQFVRQGAEVDSSGSSGRQVHGSSSETSVPGRGEAGP